MATIFIHGSSDLYGSAKVLLQIVGFASKIEKKIIVILPHDGLLVREFEKVGVDVRIMNLGILRRRYFTPWGIVGRLILWLFAIVRLASIVKSNQISTIYVNSANVIIGPGIKFLTGKKLIWHIHEIVDSPKILRTFLAFFLSKADKIIAVSIATKDFWQRHAPAARIELLYNGLDLAPFLSDEKEKIEDLPFLFKDHNNCKLIGLIARIQPWKGQSYFLDIMKAFYERHQTTDKPIYVVLVGDAYPGYEHYEDELIVEIQEKGLEGKVFCMGFRKDIPSILKYLDLVVVSSVLPDPLPTVVLEAMASKKPVFSTEQGGALEMIVPDVTGIFMPLGNHFKASQMLEMLIFDDKKLKDLGENGFKRVKSHFSIDSFEENWLQIFCSVDKSFVS